MGDASTTPDLAQLRAMLRQNVGEKAEGMPDAANAIIDTILIWWPNAAMTQPYGSTEVYSSEATQSCNRYPLIAAWTEGFLRPMIQRAAYALVPRGWMLLNVANTRQHPTLVEDVERVAGEEGFGQHAGLQLAMSNIQRGGLKSEPVLCFRLR